MKRRDCFGFTDRALKGPAELKKFANGLCHTGIRSIVHGLQIDDRSGFVVTFAFLKPVQRCLISR